MPVTSTQDGKKTILLVEDEAAIATAEKRVLEKHGFRVLLASSGIKAVEATKKTGRIDLILMDINLGRGMDGIEAAEIILHQNDVPVVFLSDSTQPQVVKETDRVASYGFVVKDSPEAVLIASIRMAFRLHDACRELKEKERMLSMEEERLRKAQAIARVGNWELDLRTNKVWASEEAFRIYGIEEVTPELPLALVQQSVLSPYRAGMDRALHRLAKREGEYDEEYQIKRSNDGLLRFIHSRAELTLAEDGTPTRVAGVIQDITELRQRESELSMLNRTLRALSGSSEAMMRAGGEAEYLEAVCSVLVESCGYSMVWIGLAEEGEGKRVKPAAWAGFDEDYVKHVNVTWADTERGRGPAGTATRTGKPAICNALADPSFVPWREEALKRGYVSVLGLPLMNNGRALGAITLYSPEADQFSEEEVGLLTRLSDDLVYGITTLRLREEHVRSEESLRWSEARFRSLFETSRDSILLVNRETGRILGANPAACRLYGYSLEEFLALKNTDISTEQEKTETAVLQSVSEVPFRLHRKKDGTVFPVEISGGSFEEANLRLYTAFIRDITDRQQAEARLRESEELYRVAIEHSNDGVALHRGPGLIYGNQRFLDMFGYDSLEEARHTDRFLKIHPDDREMVAEYAARRQRGEPAPSPYECRGIGKNGATMHLEVSVADVVYLGEPASLAYLRDVTERKEAEEKLRASRLQLAVAADMAKIAYWEHEESTGEFLFNDAFYALYGTTAEQEGGYRMPTEDYLRRFVHPDEQEKLGLVIEEHRARTPTDDLKQVEHRAIRRDGEVMHVLTWNRVVRDQEGRILRAVGVNQDITARKEMEEALRESKTRLDLALQSASMGVWHWDLAPDRRCFDDQACRLLGFEPATFTGASGEFFRAVHPDDRAMLRAALARTIERDLPYEPEFRAIWPDGSVHYIAARGRLVRNDSSNKPERISGINWDVTERVRAEEALRESETKLRAILEGSRDAIALSRDGLITFANHAHVSLFGYEGAGELVGMPIVDLIAPENRGLVAGMLKKRAAGEPAPQFFEVTAQKKDGTRFFIECSVSAYVLKGERLVLAILRDVTDRRRAEDEVRMLKHSIDVHYDGAYWMNTANEFVYVNDAACKSLGYEREDLMGKTLYQISPPATAEGMEKVWEGLRKGGSFLGKSVHRRKDGSEFPVEFVITYVQFGGRELACGFARDVTEKRRLEDQLRQAQKMEAVGTLAGGVAHDFNNILTVIMSFGNLLQAGIAADDPLRPYIDQIVVSSERAADLTRSLLAFGRKQRITPEAHTVNGVVESTANLLKRLLPEDIDLTCDLTDEATLTMLDATQIGQVIMNLATNARDAMPHGGSLTISTELAMLDNQFEKAHGFGRPGAYVKLSVTDTGMGMDEETMKRIFEPFFTTKEVGKGTGLGLASAYGIVKQHGGYITVSSTLSEGTTFDLYLPLIDAPRPRAAFEAPETEGGTETILIVEDDGDVRNMVGLILKSQGYATLEAADGDDAVRLYREHREKVDLVILDVVMPGRNGKEVLDEITRVNPSVKALFVSGYTGDIVIDKGIQSESVDFLQKPLSVPKLLSKVREVLDR